MPIRNTSKYSRQFYHFRLQLRLYALGITSKTIAAHWPLPNIQTWLIWMLSRNKVNMPLFRPHLLRAIGRKSVYYKKKHYSIQQLKNDIIDSYTEVSVDLSMWKANGQS